MQAVIKHGHSADGSRHAIVAQLRVLIAPSVDGGYYAQGLEIDYVSTGKTIEEVKNNFTRGLLLTVESYIRRNRSLMALFSKSHTPPEAWQAWFEGANKDHVTCVTVFDAPNFFHEVAFMEPVQKEAA